jgi:multiple sugar transport system permease protein
MATTRQRRGFRGDERVAILFLLPWILGLVFFLAIPLLWGIWISLTDEQIVKVGEFVGLANYEEILTDDPLFIQALGVTLRWLLLTTPLFMVTGLALALLLNQRLPGMHIFRTVLFVPTVLSGVAVAVLWVVLLNGELGAVNQVLRAVGIDDPPNWFRDPDWAMPAVAIMSIWGIGGSAIIWLAGLQNIPPHLYEAASIDGAGVWLRFRHITLPYLAPMIGITVLLRTIWISNAAEFIVVMTGGGPANATQILPSYIFSTAYKRLDFGYASAIATVLLLLLLLYALALFRLRRDLRSTA